MIASVDFVDHGPDRHLHVKVFCVENNCCCCDEVADFSFCAGFAGGKEVGQLVVDDKEVFELVIGGSLILGRDWFGGTA